MLSNRLAFAALGITCVTAAAAGGYLATRQKAPRPAAALATPGASPLDTPASNTAALGQPVQETEAIIGEGRNRQAEAASARTGRDIASRPADRPARANSSTNAPSAGRPTPERASPASSGSAPTPASEPASSVGTVVDAAQPARNEDARAAETPSAPDPPARTFEELVVSADSVIGLQMEAAVSSERARVEDRVEARVVRDVRVGGSVAIPAGSHAIGSVMVVERGGKVKERARLGIRFHTLVLADGTRMPITTETMYRNGDPPGNTSAAKIGGGAAAGAILGALIGGAKGAAIGSTIGAGAGTASVMSSDRNAATFPSGTDVTARILSPVTVTIEK